MILWGYDNNAYEYFYDGTEYEGFYDDLDKLDDWEEDYLL